MDIFFDAIPLIGYIKALVHLIEGSERAAQRSAITASSTLIVTAGALCGPLGLNSGISLANHLMSTIREPDGEESKNEEMKREGPNGQEPKREEMESDKPQKEVPRRKESNDDTNIVVTAFRTVENAGRSFGYKSTFDRCLPISPFSMPELLKKRVPINIAHAKISKHPYCRRKSSSRDTGEKQNKTHWVNFLTLFDAQKLAKVTVLGKHIFNNIDIWQKNELRKFIVNVNKHEYLELKKVVEITLTLLPIIEKEQLTSHSFVMVAKFVVAYLCEELTEHHESSRDRSKNFIKSRAECSKSLTHVNDHINENIVHTFKNLINEITKLCAMVDPTFLNVIAGVYHYYKHKFIKHKNKLFSPVEYFELIGTGLNRLKELPAYKKLIETGAKRIIYHKYYGNVGRRLLVVIKLQGRKWNLATCYFEDNINEGDEDGDEWIQYHII